jgi:hypothetical protein
LEASTSERSPLPRTENGRAVVQARQHSKEESLISTPAVNTPIIPLSSTLVTTICHPNCPVKTDELRQSPKRLKQQEPHPRVVESSLSDEAVLDAIKDVSDCKTPCSSRKVSDSRSGQGSSSLRSLHSGVSADNSEASRDSGVRAFIAGSGRAVRKFAQRLLNYVGSSPDPSRAGRSDRRGLSSSSSSGCMPSDDDASVPEGLSNPSLHALSLRHSGRSVESARRIASPKKVRPQPNVGATISEMPCVPDNSEPTGDSALGKRGRDPEGGAVFKDLGIGGWETVAPNSAPPQGMLSNGVRGSRDLTDAEYDRGKPKKVKRARPGTGGARVGGGLVNPFQAAAERRKIQGIR